MRQRWYIWQFRHFSMLSMNKISIKNIFYRSLFILFFVFTPIITNGAENISVSPLIIDYETEARDILKKDITIKNNGTTPLRIYASVHAIEVDGENEILNFVPASMSDRTSTITSWLEISRARITIQPNDEAIVPMTIRINPNAKPGEYHGLIGFASGPNRDEVENKILAGEGERVIVRVSINEKQVEMIRLNSFKTERLIFDDSEDNKFEFTLQNMGDVPLTPSGEIIIYNSKGEEVTAVFVNTEGKELIPGEKVNFTEKIPFTNNIGKNKAFLNLHYGNNNLASVQDTNFYYSLPLPILLIISVLLLIIPLILTFLFRKSLAHPHQDKVDQHEASDIPLFVRNSHEHDSYDHDIDLKKKD